MSLTVGVILIWHDAHKYEQTWKNGTKKSPGRYESVKVPIGPVAKHFVLQNCSSLKYGERLASAYMGKEKHTIISVVEIKTPEHLIMFWKDNATLL